MERIITENEAKARRLLLELARRPDWPPPALLEQIIACGEDAVRPLDELLSPELFAAEEDNGSALSDYALGILGSLSTPAAIPILIRAFSLANEDTMEWMEDWLVPLGPAVVEPLLAVLTNDAAGEYHRAMVANIAVQLSYDDPDRRAQVAGVLRSVVADYLARFDTLNESQQMVVTFFSSDLLSMADVEAHPMIEAALKDERIDETFFNQEWLEERYAKGGDIYRSQLSKSWLDIYREDYARHQQAALLGKLEAENAVPEPVMVGKRLGRNDPCWCGSGKKYKKCHLAEDEKGGRT